MLNQLIHWSIERRSLVVLLSLVFVIVGAFLCRDTDVDVLPEFTPPKVEIQTEAPGLVPEEVEALISQPLEMAINGTPGVTMLKSLSMAGISKVVVQFDFGMDVYRGRQLVEEKIQLVRNRLPSGVGVPIMEPVMPELGDVLKLGLTADTTSLMELRNLADWEIRNQLLAVSGVARVVVFGGDQKQFQVLVKPEKLTSYQVSLEYVRAAVEKASKPSAGGFFVTTETQSPIHVIGRVSTVGELENSVIASRDGIPVYLKNVASVVVGPAFKVGDALINGKRGVEIIVTKQPGASTLDLTKRLEKALADLKPSLPQDIQYVTIFRQADFIQKSFDNMLSAIIFGGIIVVAVLMLFLANWRTAFISAIAIPFSLFSATSVVKLLGGSLNTMTLGGLAIAVGEVVDDAIVDVENVYRRLRELKADGERRSIPEVIFEASKEVRSSVVYATFIVALVFLPVFSLEGVEGRLFSQLGVSYVVATMSSLLIALTLTPALCTILLGDQRAVGAREPLIMHLAKSAYARILASSMHFPRVVIALSVVSFLSAVVLVPGMGRAFLPEFEEGDLMIPTSGIAGGSLEATCRLGSSLEDRLLNKVGVAAIGQRAGRAELDDDAAAPNFSEFDVRLAAKGKGLTEQIDEVREAMDELPGVTYEVASFIADHINDVLSGGTQADIAIKIFGPDLATLRSIAAQVAAIVKTVDGAVDVAPEVQVLQPEIHVRLNRLKAARYGLTADGLGRNLEIIGNGRIITQILENNRLFGLKLWLDENSRRNVAVLRNLLIDTPSGTRIPLSEVADVTVEEGPNAVVRENATRRIIVMANVSKRDVVSVVEQSKKLIAQRLKLPPGYYLSYAGQYAAESEASQRLLAASLISLLGILVLLHQGLQSWKSTLLVLSNIPLASIGGILAVSLTGGVITIGSLIGFISLFGISTRNSLLLVTRISALAEHMPVNQAIQEGALDRVNPVLMTAITAALGMLPLAVMGGSGRELEQPLAAVIVGGLLTSTLFTLLVVPALYKVFLKKVP
jgi:CzcA family heavy metal efflux pump